MTTIYDGSATGICKICGRDFREWEGVYIDDATSDMYHARCKFLPLDAAGPNDYPFAKTRE
jgi:hypothetical protein